MRASTEAAHLRSIARVIETMRADPAAALEIARLANEACMGRSHFLHVFRAMTSISPGRFLAALRMERAKALLLASSQAVTSICFETGYQSVGTFTRLFTAFVGTSPTAFRRLGDEMAEMSVADFCARYFDRDQVDRPYAHICGSIHGPADFEGVVFVGVFRSSIPQGKPLAGRFVPTLGRFKFPVPRITGRACVLAAALPISTNASEFLCPSPDALLVAGVSLSNLALVHCTFAVDLRLRKLTAFDPPVLTAVPPRAH